MFDALREIETSAIEELKKLKEEQQVLEERLARMEEEKGNVSEAVYERVQQDYVERTGALNEKARPLKVEARTEYAKLKTLLESLQSTLEKARLDKEELEFRHRLGEFSDEAFQERAAASDEEIEARQGELGEVEELKQQFIDAFRSEEELEEPLPEADGAEDAPDDGEEGEMPSAATEAAADEDDGSEDDGSEDDGSEDDGSEDDGSEDDGSEDDGDAGEGAADNGDAEEGALPPPLPPGLALPPDLPSGEAAAGEDDGADDSSDDDLREDRTTATAHVETLPPPPPTEEEEAPGGEATVMLKGPRLVIHRGDAVEELRLGVDSITVGRGVKNDIRFLSTSVSRKHAQVALGDEGYAVSDMRSGNGTMVNGEPVTGQRNLRDGDMIQVGSEVLVFRDR